MTAEKKYIFLYNGSDWFLQISSIDELNEYMDTIWKIRKEDMISDIQRQKDKKHLVSDILSACQVIANASGSDIWSKFTALREKQYRGMYEYIKSGQALYVSAVGGYRVSLEGIVNRYESDELQWPVFSEEDIRIKKWPGGTHFYAYIGPLQVKEGSTVKFDSESDARQAAMVYVTKKKRKMR